MSELPSSTLPELIGEKLYLRPATAENIANTFHWYLASDPSRLDSETTKVPSATEAAELYKQEQAKGDGQKFVAIERKGSNLVAWIGYNRVNLRNRSAWLELLVDPEHRKKGHALRALHLLCGYLFDSVGLNKLSVQVCSLNTAAVAMLEKAGFKKDATLRREYFRAGEFYEGYIYSLLRFEFDH